MAECRFCGCQRKLVKAHIIPEAFLALPSVADGAAKILSDKKGVFPKKTPTGVYDSEILCGACDVELGKLDQHAVEAVLRSENVEDIRDQGVLTGRVYKDADAHLMARFISSVLWRASISSHYFFERVRLGPYEDIIRNWLKGEICQPHSVQPILSEFNKNDIAFLNPHQTRTDGVRFWVIYANRFILNIKTDRQCTPKELDDVALKKESPALSTVRSWEGSKEYPIMVKLAKANPNAFPR